MRRAMTLLLLGGCSFVGVRGPSDRVGALPDDPAKLRCTESPLLPSLDAAGGALAFAVAGAGVILEQASDNNEPENFTKYYAGPLVAAGILYFIAASFGNTRITWCTDAKERMAAARDTIRPVR
jgi:hypothetical protein